jgi:hypothetical protein
MLSKKGDTERWRDDWTGVHGITTFLEFRNLEISALPPTQSSFRCFENSKERGKNHARVRARSLGGNRHEH